jgi:hypothetical protein
MEFLDKHGPPLEPPMAPDHEKLLDLWLLNIDTEEIWDVFQDLDRADFQSLAKIFNSRGSREELGRWLMQQVCKMIEKHPDFWERFDEN